MTPEEAHAEALRRIRHAKDTAADVLDLGDLPMAELPEELGTLTKLKVLALGRQMPVVTEEGIGWKWNYDRTTQPFTTVDPLRGLTALTSLDLSGCMWLTTVEPLRGLTALSDLTLTCCEALTTVEPLRGLTAITHLNLCLSRWLTTVNPMRGLTALTHLNLSNCYRLFSVDPLRGLTALTSLDLSVCMGLTTVEPLRGLTALTSLDLSRCKNFAVRDLEPLFHTLETLNLSSAQPTDLPAVLCGYHRDNVLPAVRAYFADLGDDPQADAEVKVYLLGNGRVGKSKLARRLRGLDYGEPDEETTHGVRLYDHEATFDGLPHPVRLNVWDFGGQDIYHASHSLFLRGPAVFLVIWCPEHENDREFSENGIPLRNRRLPYWWDYLREHAGDGKTVTSPVLLVQSQCDRPEQEAEPGTPTPPRDEFPKLEVLHVSAKTGHNLADVTADLGKAVRYLFQRYPRPPLGPGWVKVREEIRKKQAEPEPVRVRTLTMAQFEKLCADTGGVSNPAVLLRFLHETGVVFHRTDLFDGKIVVDQQWALDAIYAVCHRQRTLPHLMTDGKFTRDLLALLAWEKFTPAEQRVFLGMMESCGICFRGKKLSHDEYEYIAPDWLPGFDTKTSLHDRANRPADASATAAFRFLHDGIVRAFLARVGGTAGDDAIYWKYGFWFRADGGEVQARAEWDDPAGSSLAGRVEVRAWGPGANELVSAVLETLDRAATGTKPTITRTGDRRERTDEPGRGVEALAGIGGDPPAGTVTRPKVFISYAWGDTSEEGRKREKLVLDLVDAVRGWGYEPLYDKERLRPGDVISDYMKEAGRTAKVVAVLSAKYLQSEYCIPEIVAAYRKCDDAAEFRGRVVGLALEDAKHLGIAERAAHAKFWRLRHEELKAIDPDDMADDDQKLWKQMRMWAVEVPNLLKAIADTIHAVGFEAIAAGGFAAVKAMLVRPPAGG